MTLKKNKYATVDLGIKLADLGEWLREKKALEPVLLNFKGQHPLTDGLVIAGATSLRHAQGLADYLLECCKERNYEFLHMEGYKSGLWILLDFNDVIVHILQAEQRALYRLEELVPGIVPALDLTISE